MDRIISILKQFNRPGTDALIEYLRASNYAEARCYSHHLYRGGLLDHSLEVYNLMMQHKGHLSEESVAICALLHDLGKSKCDGFAVQGSHSDRSILILDKCGFILTDEERSAIRNHHKIDLNILVEPLRKYLNLADMASTGKWKRENPDKRRRSKRAK